MKTLISKITFVLALFMALMGCEGNQKEEQLTPLTQEQILKELREVYREVGKDPDRVQLGQQTDLAASRIETVEQFEDYKIELAQRLKAENDGSKLTTEEKKAKMREEIKNGTANWAEHVNVKPDPDSKKKK